MLNHREVVRLAELTTQTGAYLARVHLMPAAASNLTSRDGRRPQPSPAS
jgi:hypothetical protein